MSGCTRNDKMKLSIIVPVFNVESHLKACLLSIINQFRSDFEIILVDDGSTDNSVLICEEFQEKYSFVSVLKQPNSGVSKARNVGLAKAVGEWVYFVDSDDTVKDGLFAQVFSKELNQVDVIQFGFAIQSINGIVELSKPFKEFLVDKSIEGSCDYHHHFSRYNPCLHFIRRSAILSYGIKFSEDIKYAEDLEFVIKCHACAKAVLILPIIGYNYILRPGSAMSSAHRYDNAKMHLTVAGNIIQFYIKNAIKMDNFFYSRITYMVKSFFSYVVQVSERPRHATLSHDIKAFLSENKSWIELNLIFPRRVDKLIPKYPIFYMYLMSVKTFLNRFRAK